MSEKKYQVTDKWGHILGDSMSLDMALIFMKGIINEYYNENIHLCLVEQRDHKKEEEESWIGNLPPAQPHETKC